MQPHPNLISFYRKRAQLSQEELAAKIGVSRNIVWKWEQEGAPNANRLLELVGAFFELGLIGDYEAAYDF